MRRSPNVYQKNSPRVKSFRPAVEPRYPVDVWIPAQAKDSNHIGQLILFFALMLVLACSTLTGIGLAIWANSETIMPGVEVYGVSLGGSSGDKALDRLRTAWSQPSIVLAGDGKTWVASPDALGFNLDAEGTIDQAHQIGRSPESLRGWLTNKGQINIEPIWTFDSAEAEGFLQELAPQVAVQPVNAGISITDGRAEMTPPVMGQTLDVPSTLNQLALYPNRILVEGNFSLVTQPVQPAVLDTSSMVAAANEKLSMVISLNAFDPVNGQSTEIPVTPELWQPWLSLELEDGEQLNWLIDAPQLKAFLQERSDALGPGRHLDVDQANAAISQAIDDQKENVVLRIYHDERQHTVQPGETLSSIGRQYGMPYPWIEQANPDLGSGLFAGQTLTIPSPDVLLPLPVVPNKRIVVSLTQQKVWVYENGGLKWEWLASTGIDTSPTSPGIFQIQSHEPNAYANNWDLWMPHFMGVYRPVPYADFMNGFHGFPTRSGYNLLWTNDLGRRVTYGCILLSSENAATLYNWAEDGVVVEIQT